MFESLKAPARPVVNTNHTMVQAQAHLVKCHNMNINPKATVSTDLQLFYHEIVGDVDVLCPIEDQLRSPHTSSGQVK